MALDFQKLGSVPSVEEPSDTASVLIEEGGDIKRAPKSAVGGSHSMIVELAVEVDTENSPDSDGNTVYKLVGTEINYDPIYDLLMEGGTVWLKLHMCEGYGGESTKERETYGVVEGWCMSSMFGEDFPANGMLIFSIFIAEFLNNVDSPYAFQGFLVFPNGSHHTAS